MVVAAALSACGGGGGHDGTENPGTVTPPVTPVNAAPVAQAGAAQSVIAGKVVTLDASASSDANGDALTYKWVLQSKPASSAAVLDSLSSVKPTFVADVAGTYVATLIVNDGKINSESSSVTITASVANAAPVANAGNTQTIAAGAAGVMLDGSASSDANGDRLTFKWSLLSKPAGSSVVQLRDAGSARPYLPLDVPGAYEVGLVVNDGQVDSAQSRVTVTVLVVNVRPEANAGVSQNVRTGSTVFLDASSSSDPNGDTLTYYWTLTSRPDGSTATLSSDSLVKPSFIADKAGIYLVALFAKDNVYSSSASVTIRATSTNAAPVANAGVAQRVLTGTTGVLLDGRGSTDADGDKLTYKWTFISVPPDSTPQPFSDELARTTAVPKFLATVPGTYVASLVVNDGTADSVPSTVTIIATAGLTNAVPMANAGIDQVVAPGTTVRLSGLGSTDANHDPLTYRWQLKSKPVGSQAVLSSLTVAEPTFVADLPGDYVARLIVNDGSVNSDEDNMTVTATPNLLNLYQVQGDLAGQTETKVGLPYAANAAMQKSCTGACTANFTVDTFKVAAVGSNFTMRNVTAIDSTGSVVPAIVGLVSGQVIAAGSSATFSLVSPRTNGKTAKLTYKFFVAETGQSFIYNADFTSN